jgi:hypothetical protein
MEKDLIIGKAFPDETETFMRVEIPYLPCFHLATLSFSRFFPIQNLSKNKKGLPPRNNPLRVALVYLKTKMRDRSIPKRISICQSRIYFIEAMGGFSIISG